MLTEPIKLPLKMFDLETAFEMLGTGDHYSTEFPNAAFLNLKTGELKWPEEDSELDDLWSDDEWLRLPQDMDRHCGFETMEAFVDSLETGRTRDELERAIRGKGAFRRFKNVVFGGGDVELKYAWNHFESTRRRERIVDWLRSEAIDPQWSDDPFPATKELPDKRPDLLRAVLEFVRTSREIPGVRRIALLGSLATDKRVPKDVDVLVEISDDMNLGELARRARQLAGKVNQTGDNCGADVLLCDAKERYLGRTCPWSRCAPGIRVACEAQTCGQRPHLYDDLQNLKLKPQLIAQPPLELWPKLSAHVDLPEDVRSELVRPLEDEGLSDDTPL